MGKVTAQRPPVGKGATASARFGDETPGSGGLPPLLGREVETVSASLVFNSLEFGGFKTRVIELLPDT